MYMLPFGYAARATRMVSCGTGLIPCALRDMDALLMAFPPLLYLPFLASPFLYRQRHTLSPAVSYLLEIQAAGTPEKAGTSRAFDEKFLLLHP